MARNGSTDVIDLSGNGKGISLNVGSSGFLPEYTATELLTYRVERARIVFDRTNSKIKLGDGATLGGKLVTSA